MANSPRSPVEDLKDEIARGQVIVIAGTGVSLSATRDRCASWQGLLKHGVEYCQVELGAFDEKKAQSLSDDIDSGDLDRFLSAAEFVSAKLGAPDKGEYLRWLQQTIGQLKAENTDVIEALHQLGTAIATTNYDDLIEVTTELKPITWRDYGLAEQVLRGALKDSVLHLHGHWRTPGSVVLGIRSYEQIVANAQAQNLQRALQTMKTVLFVGCAEGLDDPNFGRLMKWTKDVLASSTYRKYLLAREPEVEKLKQAHPELTVISYGKEYSDLTPFLLSLKPTQAAKPEPLSKPVELPGADLCFGRDQEIEELVAHLCSDLPQPTPILGEPGIGKSTLTLVALHDERVHQHYGEQRFFVRCDAAKSRSDLAATIALTLGLMPTPEIEPIIRAKLAEAPTVLALDNLETPWEADRTEVEEWLKMLAGVRGLTLVASIRGNERPPNLAWRKAFNPQPLDLPEARRAFLAYAADDNGVLARDELLEELLRAVDGVPLALKLLGAAAQGEPNLKGLWKRWQDEKTELLRYGKADTRLTNIEVSYEISLKSPRMTDDARRLLKLLALLPDGLAERDFEVVFPRHVHGAAATLRKAGLVFDERERLLMHAPLREYISRKYSPPPFDLDRMVKHFVTLALEGEKLGKDGGAEASQRLLPEAANLEAMILRGLSERKADKAIQAALALGEMARFTGIISVAPLEQAKQVALRNGKTRLAAWSVLRLARIALLRSRHDEAQSRYEEALLFFRQAGDVQGEANCIHGLGEIAMRKSQYDEAQSRYEQALPLYRQVGNLQGEANCIHGLGEIAMRKSQYDEAQNCYEQALPLYRQVGALLGEANCIHGLGEIAMQKSQYDEAQNCYEQALPLYRQVGNLRGEANCIRGLGEIAMRKSQYDEAQNCYEQALPFYRQVGDLISEANCIIGLGEIAMQKSQYDEAQSRYEQALLLSRQAGDLVSEANCIHGLGEVARELSEYILAKELYGKALPLYLQAGELNGQAICYLGEGNLSLALLEFEKAEKLLNQALTIFQQISSLDNEAECRVSLGELAVARDDKARASAEFKRALELSSDPHWIGKAHQRLARLTDDKNERASQIQAAHAAWQSIERTDLIQQLDDEFGRLD